MALTQLSRQRRRLCRPGLASVEPFVASWCPFLMRPLAVSVLAAGADASSHGPPPRIILHRAPRSCRRAGQARSRRHRWTWRRQAGRHRHCLMWLPAGAGCSCIRGLPPLFVSAPSFPACSGIAHFLSLLNVFQVCLLHNLALFFRHSLPLLSAILCARRIFLCPGHAMACTLLLHLFDLQRRLPSFWLRQMPQARHPTPVTTPLTAPAHEGVHTCTPSSRPAFAWTQHAAGLQHRAIGACRKNCGCLGRVSCLGWQAGPHS